MPQESLDYLLDGTTTMSRIVSNASVLFLLCFISVSYKTIQVSKHAHAACILPPLLLDVPVHLTALSTVEPTLRFTTTTTTTTPTNSNRTLYPGELPGYTGWPRPSVTLVSHFELLQNSFRSSSEVDTYWTCSVRCAHTACATGRSLFYARAYGPAILPGLITDHRNGTYDVTFLPMDQGRYTVELVLTFSTPPPFHAFPLPAFTEPVYEGYMLPSFPLQLSVLPSSREATVPAAAAAGGLLPLCTMSDMIESSPTTSALERGRWVLAEKNSEKVFSAHDRQSENITLDGYQRGVNSLGIRMEYRPRNCALPPARFFTHVPTFDKCLNKSSSRQLRNKPLHFLLVGDSNMRAQLEWYTQETFFGSQVETFFRPTHTGINAMMQAIKDFYAFRLLVDPPDTEYVLIFNSGLHDIQSLCGSEYFGVEINFAARGDARCGDLYRRRITELATMTNKIPTILTVFQTTMVRSESNRGPVWTADSGCASSCLFLLFFSRVCLYVTYSLVCFPLAVCYRQATINGVCTALDGLPMRRNRCPLSRILPNILTILRWKSWPLPGFPSWTPSI